MSQYQTGSVTVVSGEATVVGSGTSWLTNASTGDSFTRKGKGVSFEIASVNSDTSLTLSANYVGSGEAGAEYEITKDFTPNNNLIEISGGDVDWPYHLTRSLRLIDTILADRKYKSSTNGTINTTNDIVTNLMTHTLSANQVGLVDIDVVGRCTGGAGGRAGQGASYNLKATAKRVSGETSLIAAATKTAVEDTQVSAWDVNVVTSTSDIVVQVTGGSNDNITWKGSLKIIKV